LPPGRSLYRAYQIPRKTSDLFFSIFYYREYPVKSTRTSSGAGSMPHAAGADDFLRDLVATQTADAVSRRQLR
jgi:hypothetical protein